MLDKKFAENCKKYELIGKNDRIILSISGGVDSVCLAHLLGKYRRLFNIDAILVYFDHPIRPRSEIKKDVDIVKKIAGSYKWRFVVRKIHLQKMASIEEEARDLRYKNLLDIAVKNGFNKIMTAHTANDNAETVIMWLLRGVGLKGLAGIPLKRWLSPKVCVSRPLLFFEKKEIMRYLSQNRFRYSLDKTNLSDKFFRNKIRNKIIPYLEKFRPSVIRHLNNLSSLLCDLDDFFAAYSKKAVVSCVTDGVLDLSHFFRYNNIVRYEVVRSWLGRPLDFDLFFRINAFLSDISSRRLSVGRYLIEKKRKSAYLVGRSG